MWKRFGGGFLRSDSTGPVGTVKCWSRGSERPREKGDPLSPPVAMLSLSLSLFKARVELAMLASLGLVRYKERERRISRFPLFFFFLLLTSQSLSLYSFSRAKNIC